MKNIFKGIIIIVTLLNRQTGFSQQTVSSPKFRAEFLSLINKTRQKGCNCGLEYFPPAPPLVWNTLLESAAIGHAVDMAKQNYFNHTSLDGRTMENRIGATGYTINGFRSINVGENIAFGQTSIAEVMKGWFNSPGHCHNLMNPNFKEIGIAEDNNYWVQDFGGRQPFTAEEQKIIKSGHYKMIRN